MTKEFNNFSELTKRLLSVSKTEIDKRHKEWEKEKTGIMSLTKADAAVPAILPTVVSWLALLRYFWTISCR